LKYVLAACIPLGVVSKAFPPDQVFAKDITEATFLNIPESDFIEFQGKQAVSMLGGQVGFNALI
jgi:hypothetical protein